MHRSTNVFSFHCGVPVYFGFWHIWIGVSSSYFVERRRHIPLYKVQILLFFMQVQTFRSVIEMHRWWVQFCEIFAISNSCWLWLIQNYLQGTADYWWYFLFLATCYHSFRFVIYHCDFFFQLFKLLSAISLHILKLTTLHNFVEIYSQKIFSLILSSLVVS